MTDDTRGAIVDLALLGVAAVAVYVVVTTPPLRRSSWRLLKYALFTALPTYVWQETTRAWAESANPTPHQNGNPNQNLNRNLNEEPEPERELEREPEPEPGTWNPEPGTSGKPAIIDR